MPKLPPPPRDAQKRSGFSRSLAVVVPLRRHHLGFDQVVDRESVAAHQPTDAAAQCQPGDAGLRHGTAGGREPKALGSNVELAPQARRPGLAPSWRWGLPGCLSWRRDLSPARHRTPPCLPPRGLRREPRSAGRAPWQTAGRRWHPRHSRSGLRTRAGVRSPRSRRSGPRRILSRRELSAGLRSRVSRIRTQVWKEGAYAETWSGRLLDRGVAGDRDSPGPPEIRSPRWSAWM